jgi:hypothetical protein
MKDEDDLMPGTLFRTMQTGGPTGRAPNPKCNHTTCKRATREGKPYCSEHVEFSPYVRRIIEELELRDQEAALLNAGKRISRDGHLVRETLLMLEQGSYTSAKLSRLMDISHSSTETLIRVMDEMGLASMSKTDRGALVISKLGAPKIDGS